MSEIIWLTSPGTIGTIPLYVPVDLTLLSYNSSNRTLPVSYAIIYGSLPPGLTLNANGTISGSAISATYFTQQTYQFTVRATSAGVLPSDRIFSINVKGSVNSDLQWITPAGNLGTIPAGTFFQLPLEVVETQANTTVTFSFLSGELPLGLEVDFRGFLTGVPELPNAIAVDQSQTFDFTIRATNSLNHIQDRSFSINITNVTGPVIIPNVKYLGSYFDGTYYTQQLSVTELNPNVSISWSNIGNLPPGITLSPTGALSGYILPNTVTGNNGPAGYDGDLPAPGTSGAILDYAEYGYAPYDFNQISQTINYNFTIRAFDGVNYDLQNYLLSVVSRAGFTADNGNVLVDNSYLTVDAGNIYLPIITNSNVTTLPTGRAGAYYAYKFNATDFQNDTIIYSLVDTVGTFDAYVLGLDAGFDFNGDDINHVSGVGFDSYSSTSSGVSNLPGLILDQQSGWLYGQISPQSSAYQTYKFGIKASKIVNGVQYNSLPLFVTLPVLGNINDVIEWTTPNDLGSINNGSVSEIYISAISKNGNPLTYNLVDQSGVKIRLPQGLMLLPSGEISGRTTFEAFSLDGYSTTFDNNQMTIDRVYQFTVEATDGNISSTQQFTITLNVVDQEPFNDIYLRALPELPQRQIWYNSVNNTEIFPANLIYRPDDPWFGVKQDIEMLFLPGLKPDDYQTYANALTLNHFTKSFNFGNINVAAVLDSNYQVKYEVVYIDIQDPELNSSGLGPNNSINLSSTIANPYKDANGNSYDILYPNSSTNMKQRLLGNIGYYDPGALPTWMSSNLLQPSGGFSAPLGYIPSVVVAYVKPGYGELVAYRLKNSLFNFKNIEFTVDRYFLDNYYSSNWDSQNNVYFKGHQTTFDALPNQNIGVLSATVSYGATIPYDQINGRPIEYVNANGGIDGITNYASGDTIVFVQQENFLNAGPYDGWVDYLDAYIGDNILTPIVEGYDSEAFDKYSVIPGYLEKTQGISNVNQRGGVWQIQIINGIVNLLFVQEIEPNQRVRISFGKTYGGSIVYYNQSLQAGATVPYYSIYRFTPTVNSPTTFNGDTTKFFDFRDHYYTPNNNDNILKFPKHNIFV